VDMETEGGEVVVLVGSSRTELRNITYFISWGG
jgi:hypothetical protein